MKHSTVTKNDREKLVKSYIPVSKVLPTGAGAISTKVMVGILLSALALAGSVAAMIIAMHPLKIGYVRSNELVYGYAGMKEARSLYERKQKEWQAEIDTLQADYQKALAAYNLEFARLTAEERKQREEFLAKQEENLRQHSYVLAAKAKEEDEKMTQGVLSQINAVAQEYGEEHGYHMIMATTQSGNILYGSDAIDLTKELLVILNREYNSAAEGVHGVDSTK